MDFRIFAAVFALMASVLYQSWCWYRQRRVCAVVGADDSSSGQANAYGFGLYSKSFAEGMRLLGYLSTGFLILRWLETEWFLLLATVLVVVSAWVDYGYLRGRRAAGVQRHELLQFCCENAWFLAVFYLLKCFAFQHYNVPTGSLEPTVRIGDYILVNQFVYGWHLPITNTLVAGNGLPKRGEIVVFRYPNDPRQMWVKRVVGLPGDHIVYRDKQLFVNGQAMLQRAVAQHPRDRGVLRKLEEFPGHYHEVYQQDALPSEDIDIVVDAGHYFMLGDNRSGSWDSRHWGQVPVENLVGRGEMILLSWDGMGIDWSRLGKWL